MPQLIVGILNLWQNLVIYIETIISSLILEGVFGLKFTRTEVVHVSDITVAKSHMQVLVTSLKFHYSVLVLCWCYGSESCKCNSYLPGIHIKN